LGGLVLGAVIGGISGLVGIGGGAFLIPALIFFYGMSQKTAQGTSLATLLLPIGIFAFRTYYKAGQCGRETGAAHCCRFRRRRVAGGQWAQHLSDVLLRRFFAVLLILLAAKLMTGR
jgi:hypothetical protein